MGTKCAYCGSNKKITREHIWPKCIIESYKGNLKNYRSDIDKHFEGDATVKDVCEECNNGALSRIDEYMCSIYKSKISNVVKLGESTTLNYNYNMLSRALLKISYNSSRTISGSRAEGRTSRKSKKRIKESKDILKGISSYILGERGYLPGLVIKLMVVTESEVEDGGTKKDKVEPLVFRTGEMKYEGELSHRFIKRVVAMKSYWFYIFYPKKKISKKKYKDFLRGVDEWSFQTGKIMSKSDESISFRPSETTWFVPEMMGDMWKSKVESLQ